MSLRSQIFFWKALSLPDGFTLAKRFGSSANTDLSYLILMAQRQCLIINRLTEAQVFITLTVFNCLTLSHCLGDQPSVL